VSTDRCSPPPAGWCSASTLAIHLVLGPGAEGKPVRFRVKLDGTEPGADHGVDVDAGGSGTVTTHRLYQLIRQRGQIQDHTFEIEFLDKDVQVFAFTFG
jgi:hypothetical protein